MRRGQTTQPELFQRSIDFGARHDILIVHDNPYSFIRNAEHPISIMEADGAREVALEMNSLSKAHSMAGWRVGVVVGKKEWIDSILTFKSNMDSGMFYPIQAAADTALALGEDWFRELNAIYYGTTPRPATAPSPTRPGWDRTYPSPCCCGRSSRP